MTRIESLTVSGNGWCGARSLALRLALVAATLSLPAAARTTQVDVQWERLSGMILEKTIEVALPEGGVLVGETISVSTATLTMDVRKTSTARYGKGRASIPRASVTEIRLSEMRGTSGRKLGTVVGNIVGLVAAVEITSHAAPHSLDGALATVGAIWVGGVVGGYEVGKSSDRHVTVIRIIPSPAAGAE